jgi:hypothetical protein
MSGEGIRRHRDLDWSDVVGDGELIIVTILRQEELGDADDPPSVESFGPFETDALRQVWVDAVKPLWPGVLFVLDRLASPPDPAAMQEPVPCQGHTQRDAGFGGQDITTYCEPG